MWFIWWALIAVGVFFVCGIMVALYSDMRGFLIPYQAKRSAAAPAADTHDAALPSETVAEF